MRCSRPHGARANQASGVELVLVSYEARPLEAFGAAAGDALERLLADASVKFVAGCRAREFDGRRLLIERGAPLPADAVVALPSLEGRDLDGLPRDEHGFIETDRHCAVRGSRRIYAAGDATAFPIKQGGIAAQQADAAAAAIAAELGAISRAEPFHPVLRGLLFTGSQPRYLRAAADGGASEVSFQPLWWPPGKIAGRHLTPYLAAPDDPALTREPLVDRAPEEVEPAELAAQEREAVELLLELADANARRGSLRFALKCLDAAEDVGGPLPHERQLQRRSWARASRAR